MHEVALTRSLVEIAERHAREQGASAVRSVTVVVGALSGVAPEALAFCFGACSRGTLLEGASLIVEPLPGRGRCHACGEEIPLAPSTLTCVRCGSFALERLQGEELRLTTLEID